MVATPQLKKNSPSTTLSSGISDTDLELSVPDLSVFHDNGVFLKYGIILGPDAQTETETEEVVGSSASGTTGSGTVYLSQRGYKSDGTNGIAKSWGSGTKVRVSVSKGVWDILKQNTRERLTEDRIYYVSTTGSDSNDGLSIDYPFLTIQHTIDVLAALDLNKYSVFISVSDGTYSDDIIIDTPWVGGFGVFLIGNVSTPANVQIPKIGIAAGVMINSVLGISGLTFTDSTNSIYHDGLGMVNASSVVLGSGAVYLGNPNAVVSVNGTLKTYQDDSMRIISILGG